MVFGEGSHKMRENPLSKLLRKEDQEDKGSKPPVEKKIKGRRDGNVVEAYFGGKQPKGEPVEGHGGTVFRRRREEILPDIAPEETIGDPLSGKEPVDLK